MVQELKTPARTHKLDGEKLSANLMHAISPFNLPENSEN